ncbi:MAG: molybdopterin biosynthesis protein, partial [Nitrospinota bacterium]
GDSLGRVTAEPLYARISSPHFHAAAMDGVAACAEDTFGASPASPLRLRLGAQAHWVDTGDPLPPGTDAVIMVEHLHQPDPDCVEVEAAVAPWHNVRVAGEDIVAGQLLLPSGHRIRPFDMGALLAGGHTEVPVRRRPRVAVIPTGNELVAPGAELKEGDIVEFNSTLLAAYLRLWGAEPLVYPIVRDEYDALKEAVGRALGEADVVLVNAGSSAGSEDFTAAVFRELGEVVVHGVAMNPGKPTVLGASRGKPLVGVPGYPVSAALVLEEFVSPLLAHMLGAPPLEEGRVSAVMSRKTASHLGAVDYVRVRLGLVGDRMVALPGKRGASVISSLVDADGIVRIPANQEGLEKGALVEVELLRPLAEVRNNILLAGSHDNALDLLANALKERFPELSLSTSPLGSLGGLLALRDREAHLASSHLLDPRTGDYNWSYLRRYLRGQELTVVTFLEREQGIMVPPGNPKGVRSIEDLAREDVTIVNRQSGSGTRILLDHLFARRGIDPARVKGYERVEYTHMAVAMAVGGGRADAGLGILAAARALGLDFIPVDRERYDFILPAEFMGLPAIGRLLEVIREPSFRKQVETLGGYHTGRMGEVLSPPGEVSGG